MVIRRGNIADLEKINVIRKQVNDLHVEGEPKIFKPGFGENMQNFIVGFFEGEGKGVIVCEDDGEILGYAMLEVIVKEETDYRHALRYLEVGELGVLEGNKGKGVGTKIMEEVYAFARNLDIDEVQLNMWSFNEKALKFYEKLGFETYRRHMRIKV